jgi:hypothetical protein
MRRSFWPSRIAQGGSLAMDHKECGDGFLSDVRSSAKQGPTHVGADDQWPPVLSALHVVSAATRNRGGARDRATILDGQMETGR